MEVRWHITKKDLMRIEDFLAPFRYHRVVTERIERNVRRRGIDLTRATFWRALIGCLATTRQRSGTGTAVEKFVKSDDEILQFAFCARHSDIAAYAAAHLSEIGLRRNETISQEIEFALNRLRRKGWAGVQAGLNTLKSHTTVRKERSVAQMLQERFKGIGPKQSRNLIQWLGLSRYEIPIDSRMTNRLRELGFPVPVGAAALADEEYYCYVEDGIQLLAKRLGIYPCEFDACVFASFERKA